MDEKKLYALVYFSEGDALYESVDEAVASRYDMDANKDVLLVQVLSVVRLPPEHQYLGELPVTTAPAIKR